MRQIKGLVFFGGPKTKQDIKLLKKRLKDAIDYSSGLQQSPHSQSQQEADENQKQFEEGEIELLDAVKDLAAGLVGKDIVFTDDLPYPPEN